MEFILILLTFLTTVSARNMLYSDDKYVPSKEQLELIFGDTIKTEIPPDDPAAGPTKGVFNIKNTKLSMKRDSNVKEYEDNVNKTVELNIRINVSDCDVKQVVSLNETVKVNKSINSTDDGSKDVTVQPGKGVVKVDAPVDDRVALGGDACASGLTRLGNTCVAPD